MGAAPIPVVMFHSVADDFRHVPISWLVYPRDLFELGVRRLAEAGYYTPTMDELAEHLRGRTRLPHRSVVLTFDDGYLDNWVFVEPILRRHGLRGVVWVTGEFVEQGEDPRPNLEDLESGAVNPEGLEIWGYLNHGELRALHRRGTLEIQSHATTHTWWFTGPQVVDFHHPGSPHFWMAWNAAPDRKTRWLTEDQDALVPWGTPVHQNARAMCRRYFPDPGLAEQIQSHVSQHGGEEFFERPGWRELLHAEVEAYRERHGERGRYETPDEWEERIRHELSGVREFLQGELQIPVKHHCWPGGDYSDETERIALAMGYETTTIRGEKNRFGKRAPHRVDRISIPYRWDGLLRPLNEHYFQAKIEAYREAQPYRGLRRAVRAVRRLGGRGNA